jgi:hypothetical protein
VYEKLSISLPIAEQPTGADRRAGQAASSRRLTQKPLRDSEGQLSAYSVEKLDFDGV